MYLKGVLPGGRFFICRPRLIFAFVFKQKNNMIRDRFIYKAKHRFRVDLFGEFDIENLDLRHIFARSKIDRLGRDLVTPVYDFYWFAQGGLVQAFIVFPLMLLITYGLSVLLWKLNKIGIDNNK